MPYEPTPLQRWEEANRIPLVVAAFLWLLAYSWQVIGDLGHAHWTIPYGIMVATWTYFIVDYIMRWRLAGERAHWVRQHLWELTVVALPMLRSLRLLQFLTVVSTSRASAASLLRTRLIIYGGGATVLLVYLGALAELDAERNAPGANIVSFGDSVWWTIVTIATVGYGDFYPVTAWGRVVATVIMACGVALVGVVTATVSSWVLERATRDRAEIQTATRGQVQQLSEQLTRELTEQFASLARRLPPGGADEQ